MEVKGIDFTSSPSRSKPLTCCIAQLSSESLSITKVKALYGFEEFEAELGARGEWVAGLDFPFGQSMRLIENLNWPLDWEEYVDLVSQMSKDEFVSLLEDYKRDRKPGDKEHRRQIDLLAKSISPQKLYGVPVGKMFFEGARRLLKTEADIIPMRRQGSSQVIVEAYPAIVARRFIEKRSYKNDTKSKQTPELTQARADIVEGLYSQTLTDVYGLKLIMPEALQRELVDDASGDTLDSVLCAIQAAWAYLNKEQGYGVPEYVNASEGWIADPLFLDQ
jgi:hypothetical protein